MRRAALSGGLLLIAILIQLTVLNNLRLPGGAGPDLVLVVVVAVALTGGPMEGMLGGFCAGLALDVAPPATHLVGQYALVFCLVGYGCGLLRVSLDQSAWVPIGVVAVGSAAGELLYALTGMIFGDPDITWTAIRHVLPASVGYDVLLSPFVLYAVARARGIAVAGLSALHGGADSHGPAHAAAGRRGRAARHVRCGGPGQRYRAGAPAERPVAAGRGHPGRVGQRWPRTRPGAGPAGTAALRRGRRDAGRVGQQPAHPTAAPVPAGQPAAGQPELGQPVLHRAAVPAGQPAAGQPELGQPVPRRVAGRGRVRPARRRRGRPGAAARPGPAAARRGHAGRVGQQHPGQPDPPGAPGPSPAGQFRPAARRRDRRLGARPPPGRPGSQPTAVQRTGVG